MRAGKGGGMESADFKKLSRFCPRRFVPDDADLVSPDEVAELYTALLDREIRSAHEFEEWVLDCSELTAAVDQQGSILYILMTCHTEDAECISDYQNFIQQVLPVIKPLGHDLNEKYLRLTQEHPLDPKRYYVFHRGVKADVELFRKENVVLETDVQLLAQEYQSIFGKMMVEFEGRSRPLAAMSVYQLQTDREVRERAWHKTSARRYADHERLESLFEQMFGLRHKIARNAGFANFRDYQFAAYHRFDYSPDHCKRYHETVEKFVTPLWEKILKRRSAQLGLPRVRPWDLSVDVLGRPALKPFTEVGELIGGVGRMMNRVDPDLGQWFAEMTSRGLLDLESRQGKAPGGYQSTLAEARVPFIFMNAVGVDDDVRTLCHESGHAFHALSSVEEPLFAYRRAPMEFCELASMSMELLAGRFLDEFYSAEDLARSKTAHLENIVYILGWVAVIDAFQHWMYEHEGHTRAERIQKWGNLYQRFIGRYIDWSGLEAYQETVWHRQLHVFEVPFYYMEYGIAQLGALQIWHHANGDWTGALQRYKQALRLGGSRPLPELFAAAELEFDFSERVVAPLAQCLASELGL